MTCGSKGDQISNVPGRLKTFFVVKTATALWAPKQKKRQITAASAKLRSITC
jgi:hypothetical protein